MRLQHSRLTVRTRELARRAARLVGWRSMRDCEYDFAYRNVFGDQATILDVGGCESILPLVFAQRGYHVTVYDTREYPERDPRVTSIRGDFLRNALPDRAFDFVVMISTIEHIGFGGYGDPQHADGDMQAMAEARRVLKPTGRIVVTFPFNRTEKIIPGYERYYDMARVQRLFEGLHVLAEEYYIPHLKRFNHWVKWVPASLDQVGRSLEDYRWPGLACYVVAPVAREHFES